MLNKHKFTKRLQLCVGIDPSDSVLEHWSCKQSITGLKSFVDKFTAQAQQINCAKLQSAYFERFGWKGTKELFRCIEKLNQQGITTILDGKRGDIEDTNEAYAQAIFPHSQECPDATTLSPYLGIEALQPILDRANAQEKYVFVVALSSNISARVGQNAIVNNVPLWQYHCQWIGNSSSNVGAVIGATNQPEDLTTALSLLTNKVVLLPGIGFQGGSIKNIDLTKYQTKVVACVSRGILLHKDSPENLNQVVKGFSASLEKH